MGGGENNEVSEEFVGLTDNIEPHPEKGGIKLTGYLTYNCLSINEDASQVRLKIMRFQDKIGNSMILTFHRNLPARGQGLCDIDRLSTIVDSPEKIRKKLGSPGTAKLYQ